MDWEKISWVYFAERTGGDIKIGRIVKHQFIQRMNSLWREHGGICVVGLIEGGDKKEKELHGVFHQYQRHSTKSPYRNVFTEFFEPNIALYEYIRRNSINLAQFYNERQKYDYFGFRRAGYPPPIGGCVNANRIKRR